MDRFREAADVPEANVPAFLSSGIRRRYRVSEKEIRKLVRHLWGLGIKLVQVPIYGPYKPSKRGGKRRREIVDSAWVPALPEERFMLTFQTAAGDTREEWAAARYLRDWVYRKRQNLKLWRSYVVPAERIIKVDPLPRDMQEEERIEAAPKFEEPRFSIDQLAILPV